jgi:LmbE family N-acetylglucosaminyl deacetylase
MALRRAEDSAALSLLDADTLHLDYHDAPFRLGSDGQPMYVNLETLIGGVHPADPLAGGGLETLVAHLADLIPREEAQVLYAPLGVGGHVDHRIVHAAARGLVDRGYRVAFYEDYPYAEVPGAIESALAVAGAEQWRVETIPLSAANLTAKVRALAYYRTQLSGLFGTAGAMPSRVWAFAASGSPGSGLVERIWWLE